MAVQQDGCPASALLWAEICEIGRLVETFLSHTFAAQTFMRHPSIREWPAATRRVKSRRQCARRMTRLLGPAVAPRRRKEEGRMSLAMVVDRVRSDFEEMPGLELTVGQGVRLWNLGADDCRYVLDALADAGFLRWSARRTILRSDLVRESEDSYISVRRSRPSDRHV